MINFTIIILILLSYLILNKQEHFDQNGTQFVGLFEPRYDLKGQLLKTRPIADCPFDGFRNCYNSNYLSLFD